MLGHTLTRQAFGKGWHLPKICLSSTVNHPRPISIYQLASTSPGTSQKNSQFPQDLVPPDVKHKPWNPQDPQPSLEFLDPTAAAVISDPLTGVSGKDLECPGAPNEQRLSSTWGKTWQKTLSGVSSQLPEHPLLTAMPLQKSLWSQCRGHA